MSFVAFAFKNKGWNSVYKQHAREHPNETRKLLPWFENQLSG